MEKIEKLLNQLLNLTNEQKRNLQNNLSKTDKAIVTCTGEHAYVSLMPENLLITKL